MRGHQPRNKRLVPKRTNNIMRRIVAPADPRMTGIQWLYLQAQRQTIGHGDVKIKFKRIEGEEGAM